MYYIFKSGQDRKADDEKLGCSGFTNQKKVDPINREDMEGSGDKNWPNPWKDVSVYLKLIHFFPKRHEHLMSNRYKNKLIKEFGNNYFYLYNENM